MLSLRRPLAVTVALVVGALPLTLREYPASGTVPTASSPSQTSRVSGFARDWERISIRTVYTEAVSPVPVGVPYLGFTSVAMFHAAQTAIRCHASARAALAVAAYGVLIEYFPSSAANLDADLAASLDAVPDGSAKNKGIRIGRQAAEHMIASRVDDGRNDTSIVYDRDPGPGVWQPEQGGAMLAPWLGFVNLLVLPHRVAVDGPDPITSPEYAFDYQEVKRIGAAVDADRTAFQTDTANFFNSNSAIMVSEALLSHLDVRPLSLLRTARLFARIHSAMTDSVITCWRLKYDVGFWRPSQAIHGAATDGNPATVPDADWSPLIPNPPYPDYVSGHACLTAPAVETIRRTLGERTSLTLHSYNTSTDRTYSRLSDIEYDAFNARIWSGLHFRDAMEDGYYVGHTAARRVMQLLG